MKKRSNSRQGFKNAAVTDMQLRWLRGEELPSTMEAFVLKYDSFGTNKELWRLHRETILAEHVKENPGTRPALWWYYDSPRSPVGTYPGACYDGTLSEPRKRLGGVGTPAHEVQNVVPCFDFGIPDNWVGFDLEDPPTFESEAAYLKRHGLLMAGEERRSDFEVESL